MEIDYDKLAAAILRQQQQQPSVAREVAVLNSPEQERRLILEHSRVHAGGGAGRL